MKRNQIQRIVVHNVESGISSVLSDKINSFHVQVIESRVNRLPLTAAQKSAVVDMIIENMRLREKDGVIL